MGRVNLRMLTKAEASQELKLSLFTLNRLIANRMPLAKLKPDGRRRLVDVKQGDEPEDINRDVELNVRELVLAQEGI